MSDQHLIKTEGKVVIGKKKGQKIGFPTANLDCKVNIPGGVYAGEVAIEGQKYKAGIIYFADKSILEAHILGFSGDLYGKNIKVEIREKIRDIEKFKNNEELVNQIKKDLEIIRKFT